jgi:hypothetical protein
MKTSEILNLPMGENDSGAETIKGYLKELLSVLWNEGESFSGKRPFGNSGWEDDLYKPLIVAGVVDGYLDEDGCVADVNPAANQIIFDCIEAL